MRLLALLSLFLMLGSCLSYEEKVRKEEQKINVAVLPAGGALITSPIYKDYNQRLLARLAPHGGPVQYYIQASYHGPGKFDRAYISSSGAPLQFKTTKALYTGQVVHQTFLVALTKAQVGEAVENSQGFTYRLFGENGLTQLYYIGRENFEAFAKFVQTYENNRVQFADSKEHKR